MSEYREFDGRDGEEMDEIYLMDLLRDIGQGIKKFWWLVISMVLAFALLSAGFVKVSYSPRYVASATMSIKERGNMSYNATQSAAKMEQVFPYILTSGILKNVIMEDMGVKKMPGKVSVEVEEGANIFTVYATAAEPQVAYDLLWSVIDNYPKVAEYVVGKTKLELLDESGVPTDSGKDEAVRSALKKGAFLGMLLGLLPIGIYILTRHTVKSKRELKKVLNLKELGSIPFLRTKKRGKEKFLNSPSLMNARVPQNYVEAANKLCIRVTKEMEQKGHKSILVTSSIAGEGKSTLAANLAISAAQLGKKVILVDCDLRNPSVASMMNEKGSFQGIGAVLQGKIPLEKALTTVSVPDGQMKVLYGGESNNKDSRLLGTKALKTVIEELCENADMVILDAAPLELMVDASAIAKFVDAAMYVIRHDYVKMRQIQKGVRTLNMSGVDIIGYIFNGDASKQNRGYGYGYKYYGGYGHYFESKRGERDDQKSIKDRFRNHF